MTREIPLPNNCLTLTAVRIVERFPALVAVLDEIEKFVACMRARLPAYPTVR